MSEKYYSSIQIVCALKRVFPDLVVDKIRKYTKLAIDLNGYTLKELKNYVYQKSLNMSHIERYTKKKYRCMFYYLKRDQTIAVIQKFKIDIPLLRNRLDNYYKVCNMFNKYYVKVEDKIILCDQETDKETIVSILEPIRFVYDDRILCLHPTKIGEINYSLKILDWGDKKVDLLIFVKTEEDGLAIFVKLSHIEFFTMIIKYIQKKSIPNELIDIRELTQTYRYRIESISCLKKLTRNLQINEYNELYNTDIVYFLIVLLRNQLRDLIHVLVGRFEELENIMEPLSTKIFELSEYFECLFDQVKNEYELNLMTVNFDYYQLNFDYYEMVINDWRKQVYHEYNKLSSSLEIMHNNRTHV